MISFEKVNKTYKNKRRKVHALNDVSISFKEKGLYFIVGESGAGKSTFLNMLCLQDKPDKGNVFINGKSTSKMSDSKLSAIRNELFGIVFQEINLLDSFNIYDNLTISYMMQNVDASKEEVIEVLNRLNISEDVLQEDIYSLSGGQRQRIAIARALLKKSKIIVCDEPTGSLDEDNSFEIFKILKEISKEKLVIVVTHNKRMAYDFSSNIIEINKGVITKKPDDATLEKGELNIKHRLPSLKLLFKLGLNSFIESLKKSILTLFSVSIMLSILLFGISLTTFNDRRAITDAFNATNVNGVMVNKSSKDYSNISSITYFSNEDKSLFVGYDYLEINSLYSFDPGLSSYDINYITTASSNLGYKLIGRLPQYLDEGSEVVITKYLACYVLKLVDEDSINDNKLFESLLNTNLSLKSSSQYLGKDSTLNFTIVGIYDTFYDKKFDALHRENSISLPNQLNAELHSCLFFSQQDMEDIYVSIRKLKNADFWTQKVFILDPSTIFFNQENITKKLNSNYSISFLTKLNSEIVRIRNDVELYGMVLLFASLFFIIISLVFYLNYIYFSIESYIDKIKILRSIGFSKFDSSMVFIIQGIIISLICYILSVSLYLIGGISINNYLRGSLNIYITPIYFDIISCIIAFVALMVITSLLSIAKVYSRFKGKTIK